MSILQMCAAMLLASSLLRGHVVHAQQAVHERQMAQPQNAPPANQGTDIGTAQKTFTGVITKSGDKAVLTDPLTRTSYQLDDQRKAQGMVNKNVKVTGVLDPSTGTIRVTAIDSL